MTPRKNSKKRGAILECIRSTKTHPSAEWIYTQLKPRIPDLSLGTVYRNLNLLADAGEILSIKTPGGSRFDRAIEPHAHIICTSCGRVIDVPLPFNTQLDARASEQIGWSVSSHYTIFEGLCPNCR
ncbi:MAG: transcriptional repressor [Collinsella sp.]|nr:transcriptional repressor [Collinsella sp.]